MTNMKKSFKNFYVSHMDKTPFSPIIWASISLDYLVFLGFNFSISSNVSLKELFLKRTFGL